jgi:hypothetical protein
MLKSPVVPNAALHFTEPNAEGPEGGPIIVWRLSGFSLLCESGNGKVSIFVAVYGEDTMNRCGISSLYRTVFGC